jgi:hypothetical protein
MVAKAPANDGFTDFRDALALEAMTSILQSEVAIAGLRSAANDDFPLSRLVALMAYDIADEMLAARET